jgi:hypothetical protein
MTTTMRRWRSVRALAPRPGLGPCQPGGPFRRHNPFRAGAVRIPFWGAGIHRACSHPYLSGRGRNRGGGSRSPSRGSRHHSCGCTDGVPLAVARWGDMEEGLSPPCRRPGARSAPGYRSTVDPHAKGCRRCDHCPAYVVGGAAGARNPEDKVSLFTCLRVCMHSARKSIRVPSFSLTVVSVFSTKCRANTLVFTTTKAVKRGMGTSTGASSHPLLSRRHLSRALGWLYSFPRRRLSPTRLRPRWLPHVPRRRRAPSSSPSRMRQRLRRASRRPRSPTSCTLSLTPRSCAELGGGARRGGQHLGGAMEDTLRAAAQRHDNHRAHHRGGYRRRYSRKGVLQSETGGARSSSSLTCIASGLSARGVSSWGCARSPPWATPRA